MTIMNHGAVVWLLNLILALLLIFILLDFIGLCFAVFMGAGIAFLCFAYFSPVTLSFEPGSITLVGTLGTFIAALVVGGVFARNREKIIAEKMRKRSEAANKAKTDFIANMSHDIRTPITGIVGLVQELLNKAESIKHYVKNNDEADALYDKSNKMLLDIVSLVQKDGKLLLSATDELLQLCNEILETMILESGKINEKTESFNVRELIQKNIELFSPVALNKKIELSSKIDDDVPIYISGFRKLMYRCILNLISNALKFTEAGYVRIQVSSKRAVKNTVTLIITVEDSGSGIPKDKFDVIFEHFSRLTPSFEGVYKGSGLGLYMVKCYVEAMQGSIDVVSEVGEGAHFTVTLPFTISCHADANQQSKCSKVQAISSINNVATKIQEGTCIQSMVASILIVEDHMLAAIALTAVLKPFGCHIKFAETGSKAVEMAQEESYDLILMDIGLPDFSGIEATKKIRAFDDYNRSLVPIVALTGHANNPEMRQEAINAGMQEVLSKPAQPAVLESILQRYVFGLEIKKQSSYVGTNQASGDSEVLDVIDWGACVRMHNGDLQFARRMLATMVVDMDRVKVVLVEAYTNYDREALRAELHRSRGGVCYLKLPELEQALKYFHAAVNEAPQGSEKLERAYVKLLQAIENLKALWKDDFNE